MVMSRFALAVVLGFAGCARALAEDGDVARGHRLFLADGCAGCHGTVGQGGPGVRLAPSPLPASGMAAYIRDPAGEMPPYTSKVVGDADVRDIHAYLASVPAPPKVADIPELH